MRQLIIILYLNLFSFLSIAQTISGNLSQLSGQEIKLEGFKGFISYPISNTVVDQEGNFTLNYSSSDYGLGYLISSDQKPFFVILSGENLVIKGESLANAASIKILSGKENQVFETYSTERSRREQALSAWTYLEKLYSSDSLFIAQRVPLQQIKKEKQRINQEDLNFINNLTASSYVKWYLPNRKLISAIGDIAQNRREEIPTTINELRKLDLTDYRFYSSGLLGDAIEGHFWLIENSGISIDSVYQEMQISIDFLVKNLSKNNKVLNEITNHLFNFLEKRSLFTASEYLALKVLNDENCNIEPNFARRLEYYRAMKKDNIAADFEFSADTKYPAYQSENTPKKLSDLKSPYTLLVFGASWCPQCAEEIPSITKYYSNWKQKGIEVVFVSLDENQEAFQSFTKDFPFISTCDYKKWDSPLASAYYIFATPSFFLLDGDRKIILRPNNLEQVNTWMEQK